MNRRPRDLQNPPAPRLSTAAGPAPLALLFALWSCGEAAGRTEAPAVASLDAEPIWTVGSVDGPDAEILSRVSGANRLGDGSVVVGVEGFFEVRKFGPDGAVQWTAGRRGSGPGEFARMQLLPACSEDKVVVYDRSAFRITEFDQEGGRLATWPLPYGDRPPYQATCAPDGSIVYFPPGEFPSEPGIVRWRVPVLAVSRGMRSAELIRDDVPGPERILDPGDGGYWDRPWSRQLVLAGTREGVWIGTGDDRVIELVGWDGSVLDTVAWSGGDLAATQADIDQLRDELLENAAGDDEEARARFLRESWPDYERVLPSTVPAYSDILVADDGALWIAEWNGIAWWPRLPGHPGTRWDVFAPSGDRVRQVNIPPNMRLLDAGEDWVLVVARDALGVETLAVHEFN